MSMFLTVLALLFLLCGVLFLTGAVVGLLRFRDPLQRMHAATKAGTTGAIFTVLGALCALQDPTALVIGLLTVLFLLVTVPVAGHVLGRGIYVSGAGFVGQEGRNALEGVLDRAAADSLNSDGGNSKRRESSA